MPTKDKNRKSKFMPDGIPKHIRLYDNGGKTVDRYTVIYSGRWKDRAPGRTYGRGMSSNPYHPQGFGQWFDYPGIIDSPKYSHIGKKIAFDDLPPRAKDCVISDYCDLWRIE